MFYLFTFALIIISSRFRISSTFQIKEKKNTLLQFGISSLSFKYFEINPRLNFYFSKKANHKSPFKKKSNTFRKPVFQCPSKWRRSRKRSASGARTRRRASRRRTARRNASGRNCGSRPARSWRIGTSTTRRPSRRPSPQTGGCWRLGRFMFRAHDTFSPSSLSWVLLWFWGICDKFYF